MLLGNNAQSRNFLRIWLIGTLFIIALVIIIPIVLSLLGFQVTVYRCFNNRIPCGWSSSFSRTASH